MIGVDSVFTVLLSKGVENYSKKQTCSKVSRFFYAHY